MGTIFATGLQTQCNEVKQHIKQMLCIETPPTLFSFLSPLPSSTTRSSIGTKQNDNEKPKQMIKNVILNVVGLSRGGVAAIQLAQTLHNIPSDRLQVNLMLFDPVPGNLITFSKYLDPFGLNTANSALDLSYCHNIGDVLALYPYQPLPDISFHAPVLPKYPIQCSVVEDATLGCHQGALFCQSRSIESRLSYFRIHDWLIKHGTALYDDSSAESESDLMAIAIGKKLHMTPLKCKELMDEVMLPPDRDIETVVRYTHSCPPGATIVLHGIGPKDFQLQPSIIRYLNKHHQQLNEELNKKKENQQKVALFLEICRPTTTHQHQHNPAMFSSLGSCTQKQEDAM
jgi:hypothetical protein